MSYQVVGVSPLLFAEAVLHGADAGCVPVPAGHGREEGEEHPKLHAEVSPDRAGRASHHISVLGGDTEMYRCYG